MKCFYFCNIGHGFWFRFFGYGLWVKQTKHHQPLFSERYGYTNVYKCFGLTFKFLKAQEKCNGFCGEYECKENQDGCKRKAHRSF